MNKAIVACLTAALLLAGIVAPSSAVDTETCPPGYVYYEFHGIGQCRVPGSVGSVYVSDAWEHYDYNAWVERETAALRQPGRDTTTSKQDS